MNDAKIIPCFAGGALMKGPGRTAQKKKIFLFGGTSLIGWNLVLQDQKKELTPFCNPFTKLDPCRKWQRIRLEERNEYRTLFAEETPDILIHCGGICDVEKCEKDPDWAYRINVLGIEYLLEYLPDSVRLLYVSSDHLFGGGRSPFDERSRPAPISVYGRTRVAAEQLIRKRSNSLIIRIGLPIGPSVDNRTGHLDWLKYRTKKGLPLTIVKDEYRSAVWASDLARRIIDYAHSHVNGLRHIAAKRTVSRPELAEFLNKKYGIGAQFAVTVRSQIRSPHLGRVELATLYKDPLSKPLPAVFKFVNVLK